MVIHVKLHIQRAEVRHRSSISLGDQQREPVEFRFRGIWTDRENYQSVTCERGELKGVTPCPRHYLLQHWIGRHTRRVLHRHAAAQSGYDEAQGGKPC
jgi:hypothetical protein